MASDQAPTYVAGLDLGQAADYTACVVLERAVRPNEGARWPGRDAGHYAARAIRRWPLGTSYVAIVADVAEMMGKPPLVGAMLAVDATGVGRPVLDMLRSAEMKCDLRSITITAGTAERHEAGVWHVAKVAIVSTVQVLLQQRRLTFARTPETPLLLKELADYRVKLTAAANESYNAREGAHDDLVLALGLACWAGERLSRKEGFPPYVQGLNPHRNGIPSRVAGDWDEAMGRRR